MKNKDYTEGYRAAMKETVEMLRDAEAKRVTSLTALITFLEAVAKHGPVDEDEDDK